MDAKKVIKELKLHYPNKKIYVDKEENPGEIIVELESVETNPQRSVFVAVIDKRIEHYHRLAKEMFEVIKGELLLTIDGREHIVTAGRSFIIMPGQIHFAAGHDTWIKVTSVPGMSPKDHVLVNSE